VVIRSERLVARIARACAPLVLLAGGIFPAYGQPQSSLDQVHVRPLSELRAPLDPVKTDGVDTSLNTHTKPIKVDVDLVLVPVTITDPEERLVIGLQQKDFEVFEGKNQQAIKHFSREDAPVSLGIIFDMSGSMNSKIERAREAVSEFLKTANPQDEFFLITFADRPQELNDFTNSVEEVQAKLVYTFPKGKTALLDAIYLGLSKMRQAHYSRKALLIISDGGDNHSRYTEGEITSMVKEADVVLYGVGIYDRFFATEEERLGPWLLKDITEITGGRAYTIDNPNDLPAVARGIGIQLRNQYVIGYRPENSLRNGRWHKIKIRLRAVKGLPPLHVHARTGYYAASR
jgi:Ca-activated chloride channel homolog